MGDIALLGRVEYFIPALRWQRQALAVLAFLQFAAVTILFAFLAEFEFEVAAISRLGAVADAIDALLPVFACSIEREIALFSRVQLY